MSGKHVDEKLRKILLEMEISLYLNEAYAFNSDDFYKESLEDSHLVFSKYFKLIEDLKKYYDSNLKNTITVSHPIARVCDACLYSPACT